MSVLKKFTKKEAGIIKTEYLLKPIRHIAKELNVTPTRINRFLKNNNLVIPECIKEVNYKSIRFKKGCTPHNTIDIGTIRRIKDHRGVYHNVIKLKSGKWKRLHVVVYEKVNGKIPKGNVITFLDGDTDNVTIDNLKMVSRAEVMLNNSVRNINKEIIPSLLILNELKKTLKEIENE